MAWIKLMSYEESAGRLRELYDRVKGPNNNVDNVMKAHSLRPHTMEGHSALYKTVMHHTGNVLPVWLLETIAVYTSLTNACDYSVKHHFAGLSRLLKDQARADRVYKALAADKPEAEFSGKELAFLRYAKKLTQKVGAMEKADVDALRAAGADDGEILEVNQVIAYFNYSNRLLNGLGVTTDGDILGLSPPNTDKLEDWEHR